MVNLSQQGSFSIAFNLVKGDRHVGSSTQKEEKNEKDIVYKDIIFFENLPLIALSNGVAYPSTIRKIFINVLS